MNENQIEQVAFEQWDAAGMSFRRTYGNVLGSSDGVSQAGETDPLGAGVGLNGLAYYNAEVPPEREFPLHQARGMSEASIYQDGRWIPCVEDGMPISCSRQRRNLVNGSAQIDFANTDRLLLPQIGIFQTHWETTATTGDWSNTYDENGNIIGTEWLENAHTETRIHTETFYSPTSWNFKTEKVTFRGKKYEVIPDTYKGDLKNSLNARLQKERCQNAINALLKELGSKFENLQAIYKTVDDYNGFLQTVKNIDENTAAFASVVKGKRIIVANAFFRNYDTQNYLPNLLGNETQTLIHELLHHAKNGGTFTHKQIAIAMLSTSNVLGDTPITVTKNNKDKSNPKKNTDDENSSYMNNWINNYCPAAQMSDILPHETGHLQN